MITNDKIITVLRERSNLIDVKEIENKNKARLDLSNVIGF